MKLIEIRVVIYVPDKDMDKSTDAIARIGDVIRNVFPDFKIARLHSPMTVTIKELSEDSGDEPIAHEDHP
jgi:hypothetical protein